MATELREDVMSFTCVGWICLLTWSSLSPGGPPFWHWGPQCHFSQGGGGVMETSQHLPSAHLSVMMVLELLPKLTKRSRSSVWGCVCCLFNSICGLWNNSVYLTCVSDVVRPFKTTFSAWHFHLRPFSVLAVFIVSSRVRHWAYSLDFPRLERFSTGSSFFQSKYTSDVWH